MAQIETGEIPFSMRLKGAFSEPPVITMPEYDYDKLRKESLAENHLKALRYAKMIDVDIPLKEKAEAIPFGEGTLYRLALHSKGAYSLSMVFDGFKIPPGAKLFVYNEEQTHIRGAFTSRNNKASNVFPIAPVKGEMLIIEYFEPENRAFDGTLHLKKVGHDFMGIYDTMSKDALGFGDSEDCHVDINCKPENGAWQTIKNAVVKILIGSDNFQTQCTGALINNVRSNGHPYLLTANHCLNTQDDGEETMVIFNYESPSCTDPQEPDYKESHSISSVGLISTTPEDDQLDYTLVELSEAIPANYKPYYAGWSLGSNNNKVVTIHHPMGDVKKISIDSNEVVTSSFPGLYDDTSHWLVKDWELGATEKGSSGAPLFNQNKRIIGDLSGGRATCDNPIEDYFAKISRSWDDFGIDKHQLKAWLDPDSTEFTRIDGYLPYDSVPSNLKLQYQNPGIRLSWNVPLNPGEVDYYGIYKNGKFLGNTSQTLYTDNNVIQGSLYRYKIKAFLTGGDSTGYSNEASLVPMSAESLPFTESFSNSDTLPPGWYEHNYDDKSNWSVNQGAPGGLPATAAEGQYNLAFEGQEKDSSKMITPPIDMGSEEYVHLSYFIAISENNGNADHMNLYIRYADTLSWHLIKSYRDTITGWRSDTVYLPRPTSNYRLAFEGVGHNGGGIALDAVNISRDTNAFTPKFQVSEERVCAEDYVYFMTDDREFNSYSWDFGYGASPRYVSGSGPHTIRYTEPGEKTVRLTINGTYKTTRKGAVMVDTLPPKPTIDVNGDTMSIQSEGDIQWFYNENSIPFHGDSIEGATDNLYIAEEQGVYMVEVTNKHGCSVFSDTINYIGTNTVAIPEPGEKQLKIYPVPSEGTFYIQYASDTYQRSRLIIVNSLGSIVKRAEIELYSGINRKSMDVTDLAPGIYIVRLRLANGVVLHSRLIKE